MNAVDKCIATLSATTKREYMVGWALAVCVLEHGNVRKADLDNALARMVYQGLIRVDGRYVTRLD